MRIVSWNVNHRASRKSIPNAMPAALLALEPDLVALTEYVPTQGEKGHDFLCKALHEGGLRHVQVSDRRDTRHNYVLIASRASFEAGDLQPPDSDAHASTNWLHVRLSTPLVEVVAFRVPFYPRAGTVAYWKWFESSTNGLANRPIIFIGDMNADPEKPHYIGSPYLDRLAKGGWQIPRPLGAWSYRSARQHFSTSRIDHAMVSPLVRVTGIRYVEEVAGHVLAGGVATAMSDHAALVLDID